MFVISVSLFFMFTGCRDGSNSNQSEVPQITFRDIQVDDSVSIQSGVPFDIHYTLYTAADFEGEKTATFYLLHNVPDSPGSGEAEQVDQIEDSFFLGSAPITSLSAGESSFFLNTVLPEEVAFSDKYYIAGKIADTTDGFSTYEDVFSSEEIEVDISTQPITNVVLVDFSLDTNNIMIDDDLDIDTSDELSQPYHGNTDLFGNLTLNSFNNAADNVRISVAIWIDDAWENIEIWDNETSSFKDHLIVFLEEDMQNQIIGLDLNFPDDLVDKINAQADTINDNQFTIRAYVDPENELAEVDEGDNYLDAQAQFFVFPESNIAAASVLGYSLEKSFSPLIGSKKWVAVKSQFEFKAGVDVSPPRATSSSRFKLSPIVRDWEIGLAQIDLNAQYGVIPLDRGVVLSIKWQGKKLYDQQLAGKSLAKKWEKNWYKENDFFHTRLFVGPVPINFSTGAKGGVGFRLDVGVTDRLSVYGRFPHMELGLYGRGGVDLAAVEAGVEVNGNLADVDCAATAEATLNLAAGVNTQAQLLNAGINTEAFYDVSLLSARVGIYAIFPKVKWCKKWGVSYPCGVGYDKPLYLWLLESPAGYRKQATLVHKDFTWTP